MSLNVQSINQCCFIIYIYFTKLPLFATGTIFEGKTCWLESFWPTWLAVVKGTTFCAMIAEPSGKVHRSCLFCVWQSSDPSFSTTSRWLFFNIGWDRVSLQVTGILNPTKIHYLCLKDFFSIYLNIYDPIKIIHWNGLFLPCGVKRALLLQVGRFCGTLCCLYAGLRFCWWCGWPWWSTWTITNPQFETDGFGLANSCSLIDQMYIKQDYFRKNITFIQLIILLLLIK